MQKSVPRLPALVVAILVLSAASLALISLSLAPNAREVQPFAQSSASAAFVQAAPPPTSLPLARFSSEAELRARLGPLSGFPAGGDVWLRTGAPATPATQEASGAGSALPDYTGTNVQVAGIDEPDSVKTDGSTLFVAGYDGIAVVKAAPPSAMRLLATIPLDGRWVNGLFLNGNRLVVLASSYGAVATAGAVTLGGWMPVYTYAPSVAVLVYDVSDPARPVLASNLTVTGYYVGARMMGSQVLVVASHYLYLEGEAVVYPKVGVDGEVRALAATDVAYFPEARNASALTEVLVVPLEAPARANLTTLLMDAGSTLFVAADSVYLVGYGGGFDAGAQRWVDASTVHRLYMFAGTVASAATATVQGHVLSPYSLDEFEGNLRIATTEWSSAGQQSANHLFVLDRAMKPLGELTGLAPGETIQSVRFAGDRAYVVTFRQVDPFFAIDLSNPAEPRVLGELKATGFARYLFPVGDGLVLGIGPETTLPDASGRVQTIGLKLSLFDVADPADLKVLAAYVIAGTWVYSAVEWDPHALLWVEARSTLAIPVQVYNYSIDKGWDAGQVWQGVMVFEVTRSGGVELKGRIDHDGDASALTRTADSPITRTVQAGATLYTVSQTTVQANDLETLARVARVTYWTPEPYPYPGLPGVEARGGTTPAPAPAPPPA